MHERLLIMQRPIYDSSIQFQFRMKWINLACDVRRAPDKVLYLQNRHILPPPVSPAPRWRQCTKAMKVFCSSSLAYTRVCSCNWMMEILSVAYRILRDTLDSEGCELRCRWRKKSGRFNWAPVPGQRIVLLRSDVVRSRVVLFLFISAAAFRRVIAIFLLNFGGISFRPSLQYFVVAVFSWHFILLPNGLFCIQNDCEWDDAGYARTRHTYSSHHILHTPTRPASAAHFAFNQKYFHVVVVRFFHRRRRRIIFLHGSRSRRPMSLRIFLFAAAVCVVMMIVVVRHIEFCCFFFCFGFSWTVEFIFFDLLSRVNLVMDDRCVC